ncbi:hypothetical protein [Tsukamurella soli]|uniref:Uncharacterized protein n=1 Tax=Tsukamurella soli TaxID=644556 RepID=A0ABP8JCN9_9ACTN
MNTYMDSTVDLAEDAEPGTRVDTFTGQELYDAYHEDYDAITRREARIYSRSGQELAAGRLDGLRFVPVGRPAADGSTDTEVLYSFGSLTPDIPWDRTHRIELAPR